MRTLLVVGGGLILLALGMILLVLPGPGLLIAAIGAALIAGESLTVARILDRIDLGLTRIWNHWWR
ncbi:MAG TPA: PGPGW domain-containing protein [Rudaea sp.]